MIFRKSVSHASGRVIDHSQVGSWSSFQMRGWSTERQGSHSDKANTLDVTKNDYNKLNKGFISKIKRCSTMDPECLTHEPELDMNRTCCRQTLAEKALRTLASALGTVAFRWFGRRLSLSIEHPCRSADRERQHFIEPWEEGPRG